MHIVFVTTELATPNNVSGGLASFTANMARIFTANKHTVTILLSTVKESEITFDDNIVLEKVFIKKLWWNILDKTARLCVLWKKNHAVETRRFFVNIWRSKQVRKKIKEINKKEKIDIVHYCNLGALALKADKNIPYVIRLSSFLAICVEAMRPEALISYDEKKLSIKDKLLNYTLKKARYIISPSNLIADLGKQNLGIEAAVIESPFILSKGNWDYSLFNSILSNKKYIIHYGSLGYLKGTHVVAQIAYEILQNFSDVYLVLAGKNGELLDEEGKSVKADELVRRNVAEFSDRVIYTGPLTREKIYPLIQNAELCLLPSRIENLSNACIEAMAMGRIVIATNGASYEQLIDDGINGFLCERDNSNSFLNAICKALNMSAKEKEEMKLKALKTIERLAPEKIYKQYLQFYEKVIREW